MKFIGSMFHTGLDILPWLLNFAGFALILAGIGSMQARKFRYLSLPSFLDRNPGSL
jgi:hypothetical protein